MINILSEEQDEAIWYFKNKLNISLINFELLRDKHEGISY
ncbi:hypothetical protein SRCM100169_02199 [Bacillus siamensis]|nr:hypothetical protein SRCM100169_02199 [Bacillus siamensis]